MVDLIADAPIFGKLE